MCTWCVRGDRQRGTTPICVSPRIVHVFRFGRFGDELLFGAKTRVRTRKVQHKGFQKKRIYTHILNIYIYTLIFIYIFIYIFLILLYVMYSSYDVFNVFMMSTEIR